VRREKEFQQAVSRLVAENMANIAVYGVSDIFGLVDILQNRVLCNDDI
jgi:hypothetical protein